LLFDFDALSIRDHAWLVDRTSSIYHAMIASRVKSESARIQIST